MRAANAKCARRTVVAGYAAVTPNVVSPNLAENSLSAQLRSVPQMRAAIAEIVRNCDPQLRSTNSPRFNASVR